MKLNIINLLHLLQYRNDKKAMDMDGMELFKKHPKLSNKELREKIKEEIESGKSFRDFWPKRW